MGSSLSEVQADVATEPPAFPNSAEVSKPQEP